MHDKDEATAATPRIGTRATIPMLSSWDAILIAALEGSEESRPNAPAIRPTMVGIMLSVRIIAAALAATIPLVLTSELLAHEQWPDGPNKIWLENLQRPDNYKNPSRQSDPKSLFCCGIADTVKTKFKVEAGNQRYPDDRWYAWLKDDWVLIPPEKIVPDHAPDGQPYLFLLAETIQCFVRPKGGL